MQNCSVAKGDYFFNHPPISCILHFEFCIWPNLFGQLVFLHAALFVLLSAAAGTGVVGAYLLVGIADRLFLYRSLRGSGGTGFLGNLLPPDLLVGTDLYQEHPADGFLPAAPAAKRLPPSSSSKALTTAQKAITASTCRPPTAGWTSCPTTTTRYASPK